MNDLSERNYARQSHLLVNAKTALSRLEIDIILTLMTAITIEDKDFKDYHFTLKELEEKVGHTLQSKQLKQTVKVLMGKPIELQMEIKGEWTIVNWFSYFKYGSDGIISCRFDKILKPFLLELKKRFVVSDLRMILPMKSGYSKRIYLLLKEYAKIGQRTFEIENLQELLKIPTGMKRYDNFKRQVLKRAETDINKFTDLEVKLTEHKRGRKVVEVTYTIRKNELDLKSFIEIIRENYVNQLLYHTKENRPIKCSSKGLLYYADSNEDINKKESKKLWEYLHENRKNLECYEKLDEKKILKKLILSDKATFVKYIRENFVDKTIFKLNGKLLSVSFAGDLYNKNGGDYFTREESYEIWDKLYGLARLGDIELS